MTIRVLMVTGSYPPMACGVGDYTSKLVSALATRPDIQVAVLTSRAAAGGDTPAVTVFSVMPSWRMLDVATALRVFVRWRPDVVHVQYPTQGYKSALLPNLIPLLARLLGAKVVQTWHEPLRAKDALVRCIMGTDVIVVRPNYRDLLTAAARRRLQNRPLHFVKSASALPVARLSAEAAHRLRTQYLQSQQRLVVFFGFVFEHKGVDLLFDVADPTTDHIVIAGGVDTGTAFYRRLERLARAQWAGRVTFTGFLAPAQAAELLSVCDAVVLPFRTGGGEWNSSIHGAISNGAYVVTTSADRRDYDEAQHVCYTAIDDVPAMRSALGLARVRRVRRPAAPVDGWATVVDRHLALYEGHAGLPVDADNVRSSEDQGEHAVSGSHRSR